MSEKLTLLVDEKIISKAKDYSKLHNVSLSKLVERYFQNIAERTEPYLTAAPVTASLRGIASAKNKISDSEILTDALKKKYK